MTLTMARRSITAGEFALWHAEYRLRQEDALQAQMQAEVAGTLEGARSGDTS